MTKGDLYMKKFVKFTSLALVLVLAVAMFAACVPSTIEAAKAKMEKAGYTVKSHSEDEAEGLQGGFLATTGLLGETLIAMYFDTAANAKAWYEANTSKGDASTKCSGRWVYWGTEGGVKAFEK